MQAWRKIWRHLAWLKGGGIDQLKGEIDSLKAQLKERQAEAALRGEYAGLCFNYGNLLAENGKLEAALEAYQRAERLGFDSWIFHHYRGNLLDRLGRFAEALPLWEKAVAVDYPERLAVFSDIIMRLVFRGDRAKAEEWLQRVFVLWNESADQAQREGSFRRYLSVDYSTVIGHLALLDYYVKAQKLGWRRPDLQSVILAPPKRVINALLLDYWRDHLLVEDRPAEIERLGGAASRQQDCIGYTVLQDKAYHYWEGWAKVQEEWEKQGRAPLLQLKEAHRQRGREVLRREMGLGEHDWFVCLHVREPGFHEDQVGLYQTVRNADIETYHLAVEEVLKRGGQVIRMGDRSMRPMRCSGVFDYAHSDVKSDWMDVFLCAACRFLIGSASGLAHVPPLFGVSCALTNWITLGVRSSYGADRLIPKLLKEKASGRLLSFREMMEPPLNHIQYGAYYQKMGLEVCDNEPEEIRDFVSEFFDEAGHVADIQLGFERLAQHHGSYGSSPVGRNFLEKYQHLLNQEP
jgi:putative glycosyltransferase (TIGR04372 family)